MLGSDSLQNKEQIIHLYQNGNSYREIANALNQQCDTNYWDSERVRNVIRRWRKKNECSKNTQEKPISPQPNITEWEQLQIERQKLRDEKTQLNAVLRNYSRIELMGEYIIDAVRYLPPLDVCIHPDKHKNTEQQLIALFSDSQVGESVIPDEIDDRNAYDIDIFKERTKQYFDQVASIAQHDGIYTIHIFLLGDILDGINIYKNQKAYLSEEVIDQLIIAAEYLSQIFASMSKYFDIKLYGVIGNHGRVSVTESLSSTNYEYLLYRYMAERLKGIPFEYGKSFILQTSILGHNYTLVHGDHINNKENSLTRLYSLYPNTDVFVLGHWHVPEQKVVNNFKYVANGCLVGGNIYSMKHFQSIVRPSQTCFVVTEDRPKWATYEIEL